MTKLENISDSPEFKLGGKIAITKIFSFEMAHALSNYNGPCAQLHGHSYRLEVTLDQGGLAANFIPSEQQGMIVDFSLLKKIVEELIISNVDHSLILDKRTDPKILESMRMFHTKLLLVPFSPTNENLILWFAQTLDPALKEKGLFLKKIRMYETQTSFAEWERI